MTRFSPAAFDRYCAHYPPAFRAAALAAATVSPEEIAIPPAVLAAMRARFRLQRPPRPFGLGDAVAAVAQPIARALDAVAGTSLAGCQPCKQRRAALNKALPNLKRPLG